MDESFRNYRQKIIAVYDIESVEIQKNKGMVQAEQNIASIAVCSTVPRLGSKFFCIKDSSPKSYEEMFEDFFDYLIEINDCICLPDEMEEAYEQISEKLNECTNLNEKKKLQKMKRCLNHYRSLSVFAFNGSKYDLNVIAGDLYKYCQKCKN